MENNSLHSHVWDFLDCKNGEIVYTCRCGEQLTEYNDTCSGG